MNKKTNEAITLNDPVWIDNEKCYELSAIFVNENNEKDEMSYRIFPESILRLRNWEFECVWHNEGFFDIFESTVPLKFIQHVFEIMNNTPENSYFIETTEIDRLLEINKDLIWTENIGVVMKISNQQDIENIPKLIKLSAFHKAINLEIDRLFPSNFIMDRIDMVIARYCIWKNRTWSEKTWLVNVYTECVKQGVRFHIENDLD